MEYVWKLIFSVFILVRNATGFRSCVLKQRKHVSFSVNSLNSKIDHSQSVALTRQISRNTALEFLLRSKGIQYDTIPCITHNIGQDYELLSRSLLKSWDFVVVTSPEAASVFLEGWTAAKNPRLCLASIGKKTSSILVAGGIKPIFEPSHSCAKNFVEELPIPSSRSDPTKILYPASSLASTEIESGLSLRGCRVTRLNTYTTEPALWDQHHLRIAKEVGLVSFASPSAVRVWADRVGTNKPAICIGEITANEAKRAGFKDVLFSQDPGLEAWVDLIAKSITARARWEHTAEQ